MILLITTTLGIIVFLGKLLISQKLGVHASCGNILGSLCLFDSIPFRSRLLVVRCVVVSGGPRVSAAAGSLARFLEAFLSAVLSRLAAVGVCVCVRLCVRFMGFRFRFKNSSKKEGPVG